MTLCLLQCLTAKNLKTGGSVVTVYTGARCRKWWCQHRSIDSYWWVIYVSMLVFPIIFFLGKTASCLLLITYHDKRCCLLYQKPSTYPAVLSSCEPFHYKLSLSFLQDNLGKPIPQANEQKLLANHWDLVGPLQAYPSFRSQTWFWKICFACGKMGMFLNFVK